MKMSQRNLLFIQWMRANKTENKKEKLFFSAMGASIVNYGSHLLVASLFLLILFKYLLREVTKFDYGLSTIPF